MTSLREIILGETKLQKILKQNRDKEPVVGDRGYYEILEELDETNDLHKSHIKIDNRIKYLTPLGHLIGASAIGIGLFTQQGALVMLLGTSVGLVTFIGTSLTYENYELKRNLMNPLYKEEN